MRRQSAAQERVLSRRAGVSAPPAVPVSFPPPSAESFGFLPCRQAATGPTLAQWITAGIVVASVAAAFAYDAAGTASLLHYTIFGAFAVVSLGRVGSAWFGMAAAPAAIPPPTEQLPTYTVMAPLFQEPDMVAPLVQAIAALDYPASRLQVLLLLEVDDLFTLPAVRAAELPENFEVVVCPIGGPRTKPRACNIGLQRASGERLVIYDAEDLPAPGQLREAAARFAAGPAELACLQAPLRIHHANTPVARQFALEYAALFEVGLPTLTRLGLPFPLGGTSNHFKTDILRRVGGWDPYNVTEDADLGFRLAEHGFRVGMLSSPTLETAPERLFEWVPQRTRWIKGYMQTWGVHMRRPSRLGARGFLALQYGVGLAIASAFLHGPACAWIVARLLIWASGGGMPRIFWADLWLLGLGWLASIGLMALGARRAGVPMNLGDVALAPFYWSLQTIAATHALWQLLTRPSHWDKTPHRPFIGPPLR